MEAPPTRWKYYRRFTIRFCRWSEWRWGRDNVLLPLAVTVLLVGIFIVFQRVIPDRALLYSGLTYSALLLLYVVIKIIEVPWKMDCERHEQIVSLQRDLLVAKGYLRELMDGIPSIKKAGCLELVASEAAELKTVLQNHQGGMKALFPHPLDLSLTQSATYDGHTELAKLHVLYSLHYNHTTVVTSGLDFQSDIRKYSNPSHMDWRQSIEALEEHDKLLRDQAAALIKPFVDKATLSESDHT